MSTVTVHMVIHAQSFTSYHW